MKKKKGQWQLIARKETRENHENRIKWIKCPKRRKEQKRNLANEEDEQSSGRTVNTRSNLGQLEVFRRHTKVRDGWTWPLRLRKWPVQLPASALGPELLANVFSLSRRPSGS